MLSGCETGSGEMVPGEGLLSLTRAFLGSGARSVCASLWPVDDRATGELMSRFYLKLAASPGSPARALREAQLAMISDSRWSSPHEWAPFILMGAAN